MSRCFPFPPPGYEKKARNNEADILIKEKHKEKKHKSEKDKEKKEKKDKERSKDKHKEKKDRKEKHKDKKDKERDKDKNKTSNEKRIEGQLGVCNGEKIGQNSQRDGDNKDSKSVQDLGRRIRDAEKGAGAQMFENFIGKEQRKTEVLPRLVEKDVDGKPEKKKVSADQRPAELGMARLFEKDVSSRVGGKEKSKDGMDQQKAAKMDRVVDNILMWAEGKEKIKDNSMDQQRTNEMARVVENAVNCSEGKEKNKEKRYNDRKTDVQRNGNDGRNTGNAKFPNFTGLDKQCVAGMVKPVEKDLENRLEGKEKKKSKEGSEKRDKHKEKDREKKRKGKDKDRNKEKEEKKKEKLKEKSDHKSREQDKLEESSKYPTNTVNVRTSTLNFSRETNNSSDTDGNLGKRKERGMNGFSNGSDVWPNKLSRPASFSHLSTENGKEVGPSQPAMQSVSDKQVLSNKFKAECKERKVNGIIEAGPSQPAMQSVSDKQVLSNKFKAECKERKVNGIIEAQKVSVCSTKVISSEQAIENGETSKKLPHPDLKYLSQILSVPKIEEWSDFDEQDWLFSSDSLQLKNSKMGSSVVDETPQVWAEALNIESADVCALPYVIPY